MKKILSLLTTVILTGPSMLVTLENNSHTADINQIDSFNLIKQNKSVHQDSFDVSMDVKRIVIASTDGSGNGFGVYNLNLGKLKIEAINYITATSDSGGFSVHHIPNWQYWKEDSWAGVVIKEPEKYFRNYLNKGEWTAYSYNEAVNNTQENFYNRISENGGASFHQVRGNIKYHYYYNNNDELVIQLIASMSVSHSLGNATTIGIVETPRYMRVFLK